MYWTQRMQQVWEIDQDAFDCGDGPYTLEKVGKLVGLSRERVRQIRSRIERYHSLHKGVEPDDHVKRYKAWIADNARNVLPLLFKAAKGTWPDKQGPSKSQFYKAKYKREYAARRSRWSALKADYVEKHNPPLTQEDLRRIAATKHWADVVYEQGTDNILYFLR